MTVQDEIVKQQEEIVKLYLQVATLWKVLIFAFLLTGISLFLHAV
jgi:hypothetical protein